MNNKLNNQISSELAGNVFELLMNITPIVSELNNIKKKPLSFREMQVMILIEPKPCLL